MVTLLCNTFFKWLVLIHSLLVGLKWSHEFINWNSGQVFRFLDRCNKVIQFPCYPNIIETFSVSFYFVCHGFQMRNVFSDFLSTFHLYIFNSSRSTWNRTFFTFSIPWMISAESPKHLLPFLLPRVVKVDSRPLEKSYIKPFGLFFRNPLMSFSPHLKGQLYPRFHYTHFWQYLSCRKTRGLQLYALIFIVCCHQLWNVRLRHHVCHFFLRKNLSLMPLVGNVNEL